jgi:hypothetical protein
MIKNPATPLIATAVFLSSALFAGEVPDTAVSLQEHGGTYLQDFNSLRGYQVPNAQLAEFSWEETAAPALPGWNAYLDGTLAKTYTANNGNSGKSGIYSYGTVLEGEGTMDRALGLLSSTARSQAGTVEVQLLLENDTSKLIDDFVISYTGQQWRVGSFSHSRLSFSYKVVDAQGVVILPWTTLPQLSFESLHTGKPTHLNARLPENHSRVEEKPVTGLALEPGQFAVLRWTVENHLGNGFGIDDLELSYD